MIISKFISKYTQNQLLRHASLYMFFNILQKMVPFLVLPILSRKLSVEAIGFYVLYQSIYNFVIPVITVNADSGIMLHQYHLQGEQFKSYFSSGVLVFFISFIVVCLLTTVFVEPIQHFLKFDVKFLFLMYVAVLFYFFNRINLNIWQVEKKPIRYGVFNVLLTVTENILMLYFVFFHPEYSWQGVVFALTIAQVVFFVYSFVFLYKRGLINLNINKTYMKDVFKMGSPLTLHQLGAWSGSLGSRLIVNSLIGTAAAGKFSIGVMFGTGMTLVQDSFNRAFTPNMYEKLKDIENDRDPESVKIKHRGIVKITYLYNLTLLAIALAISILGYYTIGIIFGAQYDTSRAYVFWAVFAAAFNGMYKMHVLYMFYQKKTTGIASITISTGILNIFLCVGIIKLNGGNAVGAAQALAITQFVAYLLSWYKADKIYPMPWFKKGKV